jgi:hypothetical protein
MLASDYSIGSANGVLPSKPITPLVIVNDSCHRDESPFLAEQRLRTFDCAETRLRRGLFVYAVRCFR